MGELPGARARDIAGGEDEERCGAVAHPPLLEQGCLSRNGDGQVGVHRMDSWGLERQTWELGERPRDRDEAGSSCTERGSQPAPHSFPLSPSAEHSPAPLALRALLASVPTA